MSALADGQLHGAELGQALSACRQDDALLADWRDYHLIGDVLRGAAPLAQTDEAAFLARLRPALAREAAGRAAPPAGPGHRPGEAANAPRYRWRRAAAVASLALVAGIAWTLLAEVAEPDETLALGTAPVHVAGPQGVVVRDAALEELLEAHRQQGGASVLPMPSGFLRNATFEAPPAAVVRAGAR